MLGQEECLVVLVYIVLLLFVFAVCLYALDKNKRKNTTATVSVNGKTIKVSGSDVNVINGKVYSDGKLVEILDQKTTNIIVEGNVQTLTVDLCDQITINGTCENVESQTGDIIIKGDVSGNVQSDVGDIICGNVGGNCKTNVGDINRK